MKVPALRIGVASIAAVLGWFASLATGRMPSGLRDAGGYTLGYRAQLLSYLLLVTERYPNADPQPLLADAEPPPAHPVHVVGDSEDLRRSRVTVLFRLPLVIPLLVWLILWGIAALLALILQWFVALFRAYPPRRSTASSRASSGTRSTLRIRDIAANLFPGFTGAGIYPLDLVLPQPARQNRWKTLFRLFLAIPAFAVRRGWGRALQRCLPDPVRGARDGPGSRAGTSRSTRPVFRSGQRVREPAHRRVSPRQPAEGVAPPTRPP
jgi:hypothetical protein